MLFRSDASNKISYDVRRRYVQGHELDGVMNYPLRDSLLAYILGGDAADFKQALEGLRENYPPAFYLGLMNSLGTHDTPRILTVLGAAPDEWNMDKHKKAAFRLSPDRRERASALLKLASAVLFCFPGSPTVYYGDEAGLEGFEDPLNRRTLPWGKLDVSLVSWFAKLGAARKNSDALQSGGIEYIAANGGLLVFRRTSPGGDALLCCNRDEAPAEVSLPWSGGLPSDSMGEIKDISLANGTLSVTVPGMTAGALTINN